MHRMREVARLTCVVTLGVAVLACARRDGEGPEVNVGAVPPPVSPPEAARPRLEPPPSPTRAQDRERVEERADSVADLAIRRAAAERAQETGVEAVSLLGDSLRRPSIPAATRAEQQRLLAQARHEWQRDSSAEALIWVGRRLGYLGRYNAAVETFTIGVNRFPDDPRFLRHRGHRWITLRAFNRAEDDLRAAARMVEGVPDRIEPDGLPNARGIPTSTLQSNIHYHLGLTRYLMADWEGALAAWNDAVAVSTNPDMRLASDYWRHLTLRRMDRETDAEEAIAWVTPELDVVENHAYHRLLLYFRGLLPLEELEPEGAAALDDATVAYGLGAWELLEGRPEAAVARFERVLQGGNWASFGYIAAEAEVARARQP